MGGRYSESQRLRVPPQNRLRGVRGAGEAPRKLRDGQQDGFGARNTEAAATEHANLMTGGTVQQKDTAADAAMQSTRSDAHRTLGATETARVGRVRSETHDLTMGWTVFLDRFDWSWFCTFTFRDEIHPEAADKKFRLWVSKLNRDLFGPRWHKHRSGVYWARALEFQRRGVIHYHSLLGSPRLARALPRQWMAEWEDLGGGFARIEMPRSLDDVTAYCAKYVAKGGDVDIGGPLPEFTALPLFVPAQDDKPP